MIGFGSKTQKRWIFAFIIYLLVLTIIIVSAYRGTLPLKITFIPLYDTFGHFILLGLASYLLHRAIGRVKIKVYKIIIPLAPTIIIIFAVVEECMQIVSPNRTFDINDLAASLSGILFFYWLDKVIPLIKK